MTDWAQLGQSAQVRRLRRLADVALSEYPLGDIRRVRLLRHGENTVFRVDSAPGGGGEEQCAFVLRIHRCGYTNAYSIR